MLEAYKGNSTFSPDIEKADGTPVVLSKYGFREEVIDGKTYLVAMTRDEYVETLKSLPDISADKLEALLGRVEANLASCYTYTTMSCYTRDNCQMCSFTQVGRRYICYCSE